MNRNKARAQKIAERTGKPHFYVWNHPRFIEWLWEGPFSDAAFDFCDHMDKTCGYDGTEVTDETNS